MTKEVGQPPATLTNDEMMRRHRAREARLDAKARGIVAGFDEDMADRVAHFAIVRLSHYLNGDLSRVQDVEGGSYRPPTQAEIDFGIALGVLESALYAIECDGLKVDPAELLKRYLEGERSA